MGYIELFVYNGIDTGVDDAFRDPGRILRKKLFVSCFRFFVQVILTVRVRVSTLFDIWTRFCEVGRSSFV